MQTHLYICLPILNESENLPRLILSLKKQTFSNFTIIACVNQPNSWWNQSDQMRICQDNLKSITLLEDEKKLQIQIIDKATPGKGWTEKKKGVGWARKLSMDYAASLGNEYDLIVSIDADTEYPPQYLQSLVQIFHENPQIAAHSNPYYHKLTGNMAEDSAILRYELYMRLYAINMLLISNPYAFSPLGSAMVTRISQYKKMGGISPKNSGEDFYFLQHMRKNGNISTFNEIMVYPQARFSNRVNFGTGPAMIKGNQGDWKSYPFYQPNLYKEVEKLFNSFELLYEMDMDLPIIRFLSKQLKKDHLWEPLRKNFKTKALFKNACFQLIDGLRILQYLKHRHSDTNRGDSHDYIINIQHLFNKNLIDKSVLLEAESISEHFNFDSMKKWRDILVKIEYKLRKTSSIV